MSNICLVEIKQLLSMSIGFTVSLRFQCIQCGCNRSREHSPRKRRVAKLLSSLALVSPQENTGTSQLVKEIYIGHAVQQRNQLKNAKDVSHQLLILKLY